MAILFKCPCGRSMVADARRAGAVIHCPNCHRALRVPSGKGRGKELAPTPAAAVTESTRPCQRCGTRVPIDAQRCPQCGAILSASPEKDRSARSDSVSGSGILYGGSRATWWSRLTRGGRAGILGGAAGFIILVGVASGLLYSSWSAQQTAQARDQAGQALAQGLEREAEGKFQEAYDLYFPALGRAERFLRGTGRQADVELLDVLRERVSALRCIVSDPHFRAPVRWHPQSQAELEAASQQLIAAYPVYRQRILALADAALVAIQSARAHPDQASFAAEVRQVMDAFVQFTNQTTPQQRAQYSYGMLCRAVQELADANGAWETGRRTYLAQSETRLKALKDLVQQPPGTPSGDKIM